MSSDSSSSLGVRPHRDHDHGGDGDGEALKEAWKPRNLETPYLKIFKTQVIRPAYMSLYDGDGDYIGGGGGYSKNQNTGDQTGLYEPPQS